jgi:hypothetical protein
MRPPPRTVFCCCCLWLQLAFAPYTTLKKICVSVRVLSTTTTTILFLLLLTTRTGHVRLLLFPDPSMCHEAWPYLVKKDEIRPTPTSLTMCFVKKRFWRRNGNYLRVVVWYECRVVIWIYREPSDPKNLCRIFSSPSW